MPGIRSLESCLWSLESNRSIESNHELEAFLSIWWGARRENYDYVSAIWATVDEPRFASCDSPAAVHCRRNPKILEIHCQ